MERYIEQIYLSESQDSKHSNHRGGLEDQLLAQQAVDAESEFGGLRSISASGSANANRFRAKGGVWRLQCFRTRGETSPSVRGGEHDDAMGGSMALRLFFLQKPTYLSSSASIPTTMVPENRKQFEALSDQRLVDQAPDDLQEVYFRIMAAASRKEKLGPVIKSSRGKNFGAAVAKLRRRLDFSSKEALTSNESELTPRTQSGNLIAENIPDVNAKDEDDHVALFIAHRVGSTHWYFTGIPDVYRYYGLYAVRKYVEPFANGIVIFAFYLRNLSSDAIGNHNQQHGDVSEMFQSPISSKTQSRLPLSVRLEHLVRDASLHFVLPRTSLTPLFTNGTLSAQEAAYVSTVSRDFTVLLVSLNYWLLQAYAAWKFAYHFMERGSAEYAMLSDALKDKPEAIQQLVRSLIYF